MRSLTALSVPHPQALQEAFRVDDGQREKSEYMTFFRTAPETAAKVLLRDDAAGLRKVYGEHVHAADVEAYVDRFSDARRARGVAPLVRGDGPRLGPRHPRRRRADDVRLGQRRRRDRRDGRASPAPRTAPGRTSSARSPGRSHWLPDEDPDAVVDAILARAV